MTFMHKLSARLARFRPLVVLAALTAAACERPMAVTPPGGDPLTQLVVFPGALTLHPTETADLMAVGFTSAGDTATISVSWRVTGGSIVSTNTNGGRHYGRFKAGNQTGMFDVVAEAGALSDTAIVAVMPIPVATVTVTPALVSLAVGASAQLAAVTRDSTGSILTGRVVTWSSSAPAVASVSSSGLVLAVGAGSATITATSELKTGSSSVAVTSVAAPVASVDVVPASASVPAGQTVQLTATPRDASGNALGGRTIAWATGNAAAATVSGTGLVSGVAAGSATITATSEGQSGTSAITVTSAPVPVASVTVIPSSASLLVAQTVQLTATPRDAGGNALSGRTVTWATSNANVATVNTNGLVAAKAAGGATITATSEGQSGTASVTVQLAPVASVTVSPDVASVAVSGSYQFLAVLKDAAGNLLGGRPVTWSSGNSGVATVSSSGLATGVTTGLATISALSEGITGSAALTVITPPPVGQCGAWPAGITAWVQPLPPSTGQAFYASPTGSDANPGTLAAPWRSLSKANSLQPGQILYLRAGTYGARGTTWSFDATGTPSAPITVSGYQGDGRPIIQGRIVVSGQWLRLTGIIADGPTGDVGGPGPNGEAVLVSVSGQHLEFSNSEVRYDYWHAGVGGGGSVTDYRILNNYIHDNGGYLGDYTDAQNNTSHGIYNSPSSYGLVANNVIEHNDAKGISMRHDANHLILANNTIVGNGRFGVSLVEQTYEIIAANNVVMNNGNSGKGGGGISMHDTGPYYQYNNVYWNNNNSNSPGDQYPGTATVTNPLIADPRLVRPSDGMLLHQVIDAGTDNHLLAVSPAIGHADPKYALPFDITGKCRGSAPDAGAYQH